MRRTVVLLARRPDPRAAPPGVGGEAFARALVEDTYEAVLDLAEIDVAVALDGPSSWRETVTGLLWPRTPVLEASDPMELIDRGEGTATAIVVADAPDLPGLIVAGVFSALDTVAVAAAPALRGGLVALGCRHPMPDWLRTSQVGPDTPDAADRLRALAPAGDVEITRPWRRLREPGDLASLDPGLEGWEATRALLSAGGSR